jgi:hypothetical protein
MITARRLFVVLTAVALAGLSGCNHVPPATNGGPTSATSDQPSLAYPPLPGIPVSAQFRLRLNGQSVPVYEGPAGYFAVLRAEGPIELTLTRVGEPVTQAVLRPLPRNTVPQVKAGVVSLRLAGPGTAAIELNGDQAKPIFFFVKPPEVPPAPAAVPHYFAPGKVYDLPKGKLLLKSGESVYIAGGAVVRGSIEARGKRTAPVKGVHIFGQGLLMPTEKGQPLSLMNTEDARVEGLTLFNTLNWTFRIFESSRVKVSGVHVFATGKYSDGLDIMGSRDVEVRDSFFHSHDDCIAIKGAKWNFSGNVENITLDNLMIWKAVAGNGIEIGYETDVDTIRNITVRNIAIMHAGSKSFPYRRAALSMHHCGRAEISNVLYEDITIEQARENLIHLWVGRSNFAKGDKLGTIRDVTYRRVRYIDGTAIPSVIDSAEAPGSISGIKFEDCEILGRKVTGAADMELQVKGAPVPTFR